MIGDFFFVARGRSVFIGLRSYEPERASELVRLLREKALTDEPGAIVMAQQTSLFEQGLQGGRKVDIEITGPELTKLVGMGAQIMGQVMTLIPEAQPFPKPSLDLSSPEVHVEPKLVQAADMQVNTTDLGFAVNALVDGAYASDYYLGGKKIDLTIMGQERFAKTTQDVEGLPIATPLGQLVPLAALATVKLSSGPEQINHRERMRAITIQVTPPPQMPLEDAMITIQKQIVAPLRESGQLNGGYHINLAGTADKLRDTWRALRFNIILACLITYLLMAALFESWLYPFVIILSVPLGAVGGILGLWLLNLYVLQTLDVLTMLGFVILIGTVVNNPILIIHQALNHMREDGMPLKEAVLESTRTRLRPIFATTVTTVLGLLPLVLFPGAGSELYRGLGAVLLGGLIVSTVFTLFLIPALFSLTMDARTWFMRLIFGHREPVKQPHMLKQPTKPRQEPAVLS
jgi:HAE1 family hydrophobic/amphiphilic exporter-1